MRTIKKIIIHCTDNDNPRITVADIRAWHVKGRGWKDIGYHWVILSDAKAHPGRPEEQVGAHCAGENHDSLGIAVHMKNIVHADQMECLKKLLIAKCKEYNISVENIYPHNHFTPYKTCPNFDIKPLCHEVDLALKGEK